MTSLLSTRDLKTYFYVKAGVVSAVDGVSFDIAVGQTLGVVGESGCGKSTIGLSIMRLIPDPPGEIVDGEIIFEGEDLLSKTKTEMRNIRGNEISMIFQDPLTSLNPVFTIGNQIMEAIILHQKLARKDARAKAIEMLSHVGIPSPEQCLRQYPHQLSGGMQQRAMIAMALSCEPKLLIADEPSTALDVTIQAQIIDLLRRLREELGMAIILITHNLGVVAEMCDQVIVIYAGKIVEKADVVSLFENPIHPYTEGLLASIPSLEETVERLHTIRGTVLDLAHIPRGCRFRTRCLYVERICKEKEPPLMEVNKNHFSACWVRSLL